MAVTVLRWVERRTEPWPNGMGVTHPLAAAEDDSWRVSIAEIDADAPFSHLPAFHRQFVGLGPAPVRLYVDGRVREVAAGEVTAFSGGSPVRGEVDQPSLALNVMSRAGTPTPAVQLVELRPGVRQSLPQLARGLVVVLTGSAQVTTPELKAELTPLDALDSHGTAVQLDGVGRAVLIRP